MNKEKLLEVKAHILAEPLRLDMSDFLHISAFKEDVFFIDSYSHVRQTYAPCGTAACIAGWRIVLDHKGLVGEAQRETRDYHTTAKISLELKGFEADALFYVTNWQEDFRARYVNAQDPLEKAQVAADYIDWFIENSAEMEPIMRARYSYDLVGD